MKKTRIYWLTTGSYSTHSEAGKHGMSCATYLIGGCSSTIFVRPSTVHRVPWRTKTTFTPLQKKTIIFSSQPMMRLTSNNGGRQTRQWRFNESFLAEKQGGRNGRCHAVAGRPNLGTPAAETYGARHRCSST